MAPSAVVEKKEETASTQAKPEESKQPVAAISEGEPKSKKAQKAFEKSKKSKKIKKKKGGKK